MDDPDNTSEAGACKESACGKPDEFEHGLSEAEKNFDHYLKSLKLKVADGSVRDMVGRRGRDLSGRWVYVCFPCGAVCNGENVLQVHISGNKHKRKMKIPQVWPISIFDYYPAKKKVNNSTPQINTAAPTNTPAQTKSTKKTNDGVLDEFHKYEQYRTVDCHIQEALNTYNLPILGVEYLVEHPPEREHQPPSYVCTLCMKLAHFSTILNHLTSYGHRYTFLTRYFPKACEKLHPYFDDKRYRTVIAYVLNILAQSIEDKYGRKRPISIDKDEYEKDKDNIHRWLFQDHHFSENDGPTFEEVIDEELLQSLIRGREAVHKDAKSIHKGRFQPYKRVAPHTPSNRNVKFKQKQPNYEWKLKMAKEMCSETEESAKQTLAYHIKNPEKHPLYPEEWSKFWRKRYREIKAEGKDPAKHDFKPEWIVFWTARMNDLLKEELRVQVNEIYRKMGMTPPDENQQDLDAKQNSQEASSSSVHLNEIQKSGPSAGRPRSPLDQRRALDRRVSSDRHKDYSDRRRSSPDRCRSRGSSSDSRGSSSDSRGSSPDSRGSSPNSRRSSDRHRSSDRRKASPDKIRSSPHQRPDVRQVRRFPHNTRRLSSRRCRSPSPNKQSRSRSPLYRRSRVRNRSHERARHIASSSKTKIDRKLDNELASWDSKNNIDSIMSGPGATTLGLPSAGASTQPFDDVMATLRHLVALEDLLGSLGPRVVDLLSEALTMEKQRSNSSLELLERKSALVLLEMAKEKLKGAAQAGLVSGSAGAAVRAAVVRVAATLHEADKRVKRKKQESLTTTAKVTSIPVGAGEVDRAQITKQISVELIAQGKADVTSVELAQLVEAVVCMTETKKRQTEETTIAEAFDATGKKSKEDSLGTITDLSDSDVETLLKNFHQLSSVEQIYLAAYLKKLEAKEPQRMERLSQYVNNPTTAAATPADSQLEPINNEMQEATPVEAKSKYHTDTTIKEVHSPTKNDKEIDIAKENIEKPKPEQINQEESLESYLKDITKYQASSSDMFGLIREIKTTSAAPNVPKALPSLTDFDSDGEDLKTGVEASQPQIQDSPKRPATVTSQSLLLETSNMESSYSKQGGMLPLKHEQERPEQLSPQLKSHTFPTTQNFQQFPQHKSCNNQSFNLQTLQNRSPLEKVRESKHFNDNRHQRFQNQFTNNMQDNRDTAGPRYNFMNGRGQNNYDTRPQNVSNYYRCFDNQQNSFRGRGGRGFYNGGMRGRGFYNGDMRGRGRGYY